MKLVIEYNPYHDRGGKFTTPSGASSMAPYKGGMTRDKRGRFISRGAAKAQVSQARAKYTASKTTAEKKEAGQKALKGLLTVTVNVSVNAGNRAISKISVNVSHSGVKKVIKKHLKDIPVESTQSKGILMKDTPLVVADLRKLFKDAKTDKERDSIMDGVFKFWDNLANALPE